MSGSMMVAVDQRRNSREARIAEANLVSARNPALTPEDRQHGAYEHKSSTLAGAFRAEKDPRRADQLLENRLDALGLTGPDFNNNPSIFVMTPREQEKLHTKLLHFVQEIREQLRISLIRDRQLSQGDVKDQIKIAQITPFNVNAVVEGKASDGVSISTPSKTLDYRQKLKEIEGLIQYVGKTGDALLDVKIMYLWSKLNDLSRLETNTQAPERERQSSADKNRPAIRTGKILPIAPLSESLAA